MNKILTIVLAAACLFACGQVLASDVTNVALSSSNGTTVATININHINEADPIRFSHQIEEAKDGKPFRVIVDILTARHRLGANKFLSLPDCPMSPPASDSIAGGTCPRKVRHRRESARNSRGSARKDHGRFPSTARSTLRKVTE